MAVRLEVNLHPGFHQLRLTPPTETLKDTFFPLLKLPWQQPAEGEEPPRPPVRLPGQDLLPASNLYNKQLI